MLYLRLCMRLKNLNSDSWILKLITRFSHPFYSKCISSTGFLQSVSIGSLWRSHIRHIFWTIFEEQSNKMYYWLLDKLCHVETSFCIWILIQIVIRSNQPKFGFVWCNIKLKCVRTWNWPKKLRWDYWTRWFFFDVISRKGVTSNYLNSLISKDQLKLNLIRMQILGLWLAVFS